MAMPMSACWSAGPSFTPSPVMATTWPRACRDRAIRSLSSGETRATTVPSRSSKAPRTSSSSGSSLPSMTWAPATQRPVWSAIARAVAGWSPVTMATLIPAPRHASRAAWVAGRGGSWRASTARRVRSRSASSASLGIDSEAGREATASSRSPREVKRSSSARSRSAATWASSHRSSTASGAPFTSTPSAVAIDIRRRRGSKGKRARTSGADCDGTEPVGQRVDRGLHRVAPGATRPHHRGRLGPKEARRPMRAALAAAATAIGVPSTWASGP